MKKFVSLFLALVLLIGTVPMTASAARISGTERICEVCQSRADLDGDGALDPGDAMYLLSCILFPWRYTVLEHADHTNSDCAKCLTAGDLNDDGSILIAGEAIVGKTAEEATELIITLAALAIYHGRS